MISPCGNDVRGALYTNYKKYERVVTRNINAYEPIKLAAEPAAVFIRIGRFYG